MKNLKKLPLAILIAVLAFNAHADDDTEIEELSSSRRLTAISPYIGTIVGVDFSFDRAYFGIGTSLLNSSRTQHPRFEVYDTGSMMSSWIINALPINSRTEELFRVSFGTNLNEKFSVGLHAALGRVTAWDVVEQFPRATTLGFGLESSYHFFDNFFVKGSVTYFMGATDFGNTSFYNNANIGMLTASWNRNDKIRIGGGFQFGIAAGYRFNL